MTESNTVTGRARESFPRGAEVAGRYHDERGHSVERSALLPPVSDAGVLSVRLAWASWQFSALLNPEDQNETCLNWRHRRFEGTERGRRKRREKGRHFGIGAILTRWRSVSEEGREGASISKMSRCQRAGERGERFGGSAAYRLTGAFRGSLAWVKNGVGVAESLFSLSSSIASSNSTQRGKRDEGKSPAPENGSGGFPPKIGNRSPSARASRKADRFVDLASPTRFPPPPMMASRPSPSSERVRCHSRSRPQMIRSISVCSVVACE